MHWHKIERLSQSDADVAKLEVDQLMKQQDMFILVSILIQIRPKLNYFVFPSPDQHCKNRPDSNRLPHKFRDYFVPLTKVIHTCRKLWTEICEIRQIYGEMIKFCVISPN